ncbi:MAG: FkbM family methyltransferase [Deinococcales bacterium]|nr:FkbM family methyltransferase [Chitinophagaceae bacterium]
MPKKGLARYLSLITNIENYTEYFFNKSKRHQRSLTFNTKPNVINFNVPESLYQVFKEIFMADVYNIKSLIKKLPDKATIIDIGANAGFFDIILLSKNINATIYAFEPLESNVALFTKTIQANPQIASQIILSQKAVTGQEQPFLELFAEDTADNSVVASAFSNFDKRNTRKIIVNCISLTQIMLENKLEKIDLLKLDCEGSEYDILYNTAPDLIKKINYLAIEVHDLDNEKCNITALNTYLQELGYVTSYSPINQFCYSFDAERIEK